MAKIITYPVIKNLLFAVFDETNYVNLEEITFRKISVPKGFVFDGVSIPWFVMWMFSHNDLKRGIKAACFHDFMCEHKDIYQRREATAILLKLWKNAGLGNRWYTAWKPWVVYLFVEIYQMMKGWK